MGGDGVSDIDHGVAGAIGAAIAGGALAIKDALVSRKKKAGEDTLAVRHGRLYEHVLKLEQELQTMRQDTHQKLDRLCESVDELSIARAKTDELLPVIREQLKELRDDMRQQRRGKES